MATRKTTKTVKAEEPMFEPAPRVVTSEYNQGWDRPKKSLTEKVFPFFVILLLVMAFALGSMWTKLQYLQNGGGGTISGTAVAGKYKNLDEAMRAYVKEIKADDKKALNCVQDGTKKQVVEADSQQGASFGVAGTPNFFVNGRLLGGAFPFELFKEIIDKELAGQGSTDPKVYSAALQAATSSGAFDTKPQNIDLGNAAVRGDANAPVTLVEFSDFQCPFCLKSLPTVNQIMSQYQGKVKLVYKHFPLDQIHPNARRAAEWSECVRDQGKFWEFHDKVFEKQTEWSGLPQV